MEEEVAIVDGIHTSMTEQGSDMLMQFLAHSKRMMETLNQCLFLVCKFGGICRVDSGEACRRHRIFLAINHTGTFLIVYSVEKVAVLHLPFLTAFEDSSLGLKLYDGDGLVHAGCEETRLFIHTTVLEQFGHKLFTWIVGISLHGKGGKGHKIDAIALF